MSGPRQVPRVLAQILPLGVTEHFPVICSCGGAFLSPLPPPGVEATLLHLRAFPSQAKPGLGSGL